MDYELECSSIVLKVQGGTPRSDRNLCVSCTHCHMIRDDRGNRSFICNCVFEYPREMHRPVVQCNKYEDATKPNLYSMQKIAWQVKTDNSNRTKGFGEGTIVKIVPPTKEKEE